MSTVNIDSVALISRQRPAPLNGLSSSANYVATVRDCLSDLASITEFTNTVVLPLLSSLDSLALASSPAVGIEGRTIYSDTSDKSPAFLNASTGVPLTLADSLRIHTAQINAAQQLVADLSNQVAALQTQLSSSETVDLSRALNSIQGSLAQQAANTTALQQQYQQLASLSGKTQTVRVSTGLITNGTSQLVAISWPTPMNDSNYTVSLSLQDASGELSILGWSETTVGVAIAVNLNCGSVSASGIIHATAIHD